MALHLWMVKVDHLVYPASAGDDLIEVLIGEALGISLDEEVLVVVLANEVLVPVLLSQNFYGSLDEVGDHAEPLEHDENHGHLLPRSEVLSSGR